MYLTHITKDGERWDQLSQHYYGNPFQYERIISANPHVPLDAILSGGMTLSIPVMDQPDGLEELPPWLR
ncbi:tail protein X [Leeia aquatica]|uniref:Phage Tail Protein X n=1 Tax=Leeia aquatica TaxID=2725557 RepID=A0A847S979_9NEIS|nr:tail protein X [Leeia aquatica]NLR73588.1 hypothetical protein [Leeia aquatica]